MSAADKIRGYAEEIQRATPPGDANLCAGHILAELERFEVGRATLEDQTNRAELAEARVDALQAALEQVGDLSVRFTLDTMHFHEVAMAEPFKAEAELHAMLRQFGDIARAVLVLSGGSE